MNTQICVYFFNYSLLIFSYSTGNVQIQQRTREEQKSMESVWVRQIFQFQIPKQKIIEYQKIENPMPKNRGTQFRLQEHHISMIQSLISSSGSKQNQQKNSYPGIQINTVNQRLVEQMSKPYESSQKIYFRCIKNLSKALDKNREQLLELNITDKFVKNLQSFLVKIINQNEQEQQNISKQRKQQVYYCLYMILLLVVKSSRQPQIKILLISQLLKVRFLKKMACIQLQYYDKWVFRILSMIISFALKYRKYTATKILKKSILQMVNHQNRNQCMQHLIYQLKVLSSIKENEISFAQFQKYKIGEFLIASIQPSSNLNVIKKSLELLERFTKDKKYIQSFNKLKLTRVLAKNFNSHLSVSLKILDTILPYLSQNVFKQWLYFYTKFLVQKGYCETQLCILTLLVKHANINQCLQILESQIIFKIKQIKQSDNKNSQRRINIFIQVLGKRFKETNNNIIQLFYNIVGKTQKMSLQYLS